MYCLTALGVTLLSVSLGLLAHMVWAAHDLATLCVVLPVASTVEVL